jgi:hypothetical protein
VNVLRAVIFIVKDVIGVLFYMAIMTDEREHSFDEKCQ